MSSSNGTTIGSSVHPGDSSRPSGYSAEVSLALILADGRRLSPGQIGRDRVVFLEPQTVPAGPAIIKMTVDGEPRLWNVVVAPSQGPQRMFKLAIVDGQPA